MRFIRFILLVVLILCYSSLHAQLGFCQGNSGDPIFTETFGTGIVDSALAPGTTTYTYANGQPPDDGLYTVSSNTNYFDWFDTQDHTPNDNDGRMLIVNSSFNAGEFYRTNITGLCENTTYEFSSWLLNLAPSNGFCGAGAIPVNVKFEIWDSTDTNLLASGDTGDIFGTVSPNWDQYALVFQTIPGQTAVILKMINNSSGGCGNDLAIDDIIFKSCGDSIDVVDGLSGSSTTICSSLAPFSDTLSALPDNTVFSSHFYQWQISTDGVNWTDIPGETSAGIGVTGIVETTFFRAKVAEFAANLTNEDCITFSDVYQIIITDAPPPPTLECWETASFDDSICDWIITGSQPAEPTGLECWEVANFDDISCTWIVTGTQPVQPNLECWETATFNTISCSWDVSGTQPEQPTLECWETATFNDITCSWEITGSQPAEPTGLECWEIANFDDISCTWIVSGTQPEQPNLECWETASFNNTTCTWDIFGDQPEEPTDIECWETAIFNDTICAWEISGTQPEQPTIECWETASFNEISCSWEITGSQPEEPTGLECWEMAVFNDASCTWEIFGEEPVEPTDLECWQTAVFDEESCTWEIEGTQPLEFRDEFQVICENESIILEVITDIENATYQWESGEMTASISINTEGIYVVEITNGCLTEIVTYNVTKIEDPIVDNVVSSGSSIIVNLLNEGDFIYSLDGFDYQNSNAFGNIPSGLYTIFVKSNSCDTVVAIEYFHFYIQKYMTPNFDGRNDTFDVKVSDFFTKTEVYIFDRYGKLLYSAYNTDVSWDGTFLGNKLPTADYWYLIKLGGNDYRGHFTLKR